jgi:glucose-1-phosphate thymidylyltransferase
VKALILAAGYATRMYPLTLELPKALLPVGGKAVLDHLVENVGRVASIDELAVVTNDKFFGRFEDWARATSRGPRPRVLNDGTRSNEERLGAIGDLRWAVETLGWTCDLMVAAGDNLFPFELSALADFFRARGTDAITCYRQVDPDRLRRTGVAVLAEDGRVLDFVEKPAEPKSSWAVPPLYALRSATLDELPGYLEEGGSPDAPGNLVAWLHRRRPVYALKCARGPHDIGTLESYREADRLYSSR